MMHQEPPLSQWFRCLGFHLARKRIGHGEIEGDWGVGGGRCNFLGSKTYRKLGLKETFKQSPGNPKVLSLLSSVLERCVKKNETILENTQSKDVVTAFHGLRAPTLTIKEYIDRIFKYSRCSPSCFVVAQIYMDRFIDGGNVNLTSLSVHRLLITSIMLAAKLEIKFLFGLDFQLHVSLRTFGMYCSELEKEISYELQMERLPPMIHAACGLKENWSSNDDSSSYTTTEIQII
ncbi:hypothetical protein Ccrd_017764 [Cynara cardunculus var. scolymus]|uniref:Cyclin PHO80-like protein n=1 Tax=Cynara cardunculus var. scolymus TaxID=59895 RepID=A0A118K281_CYNCS|nr:hypothetical protein Ccrd_017764 [Cynara cardunculus var. scolymus]